jgi:hypothetical protein
LSWTRSGLSTKSDWLNGWGRSIRKHKLTCFLYYQNCFLNKWARGLSGEVKIPPFSRAARLEEKRSHAGMLYAQGMVEYAAILAAIGGNTLTGLISFEPTWNVILIVGGFIFFFWFVVFKL